MLAIGTAQAAVVTVVDLGTAGNFAILAKSGVSTTSGSDIIGDIGVSPNAASAITGFGLIMDSSGTFSTSSLVTGRLYAADYTPPTPTYMTTAIGDMQIAYTDAAGRAAFVTELGAGNIGGMTLTPNVYKWSSGVTIPTNLTLTGGADDVWIFQIAGTLNISSATQIILSGGAQASNIFWQVADQVTLGTTSRFSGNILGQTAIVMETGAMLNGRAMAQTAVTLDGVSVVKALYTTQTFQVTFNAGTLGTITDGDSVQTINSGGYAVAPVIEPDTYWEFTGWNGSFDNVTSNLNISALYSPITCQAADLNDDGRVYIEDLKMLAMDWLGEGALVADINGNGYVNFYDYIIVSNCWMYSEFINQTLSIVNDWNWISFNVLPQGASGSLEEVMADYAGIASNDDILVSSNGENATYFSGSWIGSLQTIVAGQMYQINHSGDGGTFDVQGLAADVNTPINLIKGTNWLGYIPQEARSIGVALASLDATDGDVITSASGQNATYYYGAWYGALETLEPGMGYTLKVDKAQTFVYGDVLN